MPGKKVQIVLCFLMVCQAGYLIDPRSPWGLQGDFSQILEMNDQADFDSTGIYEKYVTHGLLSTHQGYIFDSKVQEIV